ncbi:MAG: histidine--tRNA ligase [Planctomycetes bacterium]|nr:histidine--tRNA ligase [Planctomycetota bacterium]
MASVTPRILQGFRDYLPETMIPKDRMLRTIASTFESFGYAPIQTPALEFAEVLLGKCGDEGDKLLYRFRDNGDRDVAMRYDLTVPLARLVAMYPQLPLPFKRYQIAPVWRGESPGRGRFREFLQCDADIAGSESAIADAEVIQVGCAVLEALGVPKFLMKVSNRKLLSGFAKTLGLEGRAVLGFFRTVDKIDKVGLQGVLDLLVTENDFKHEAVERTKEFLGYGGDLASLDALQKRYGSEEEIARGASELREVFGLLEACGKRDNVVVDVSLARGMDYYTSTIYEGVLREPAGFGTVVAGGRYDGLVGVFAEKPVPAVGISVGIDRLFAGLQELGLVKEEISPTRVLVAVFAPNLAPASMKIASDLRRAGLAVEVSLSTEKLGKQFKYADRKRIPVVVIPGPDEVARGEATVKVLASGDQIAVKQDALAERVKTLLQGV